MMEEKRWEEVITFTNMTHNSRKLWKTIRKLSNEPTTSSPPCLVSANQVAHQLLTMTEVTCHPHQTILYGTSNRRIYLHGIPFLQGRVQESSGITKDKKVAARDDVLVEQLKISVPKPIGGSWQCSTNASWKIRSQPYEDSPGISPYGTLGKTAIPKS